MEQCIILRYNVKKKYTSINFVIIIFWKASGTWFIDSITESGNVIAYASWGVKPSLVFLFSSYHQFVFLIEHEVHFRKYHHAAQRLGTNFL